MENFYINKTDKKICIRESKEKLKKILSNWLIHADTKTLSKEENTQARKLPGPTRKNIHRETSRTN